MTEVGKPEVKVPYATWNMRNLCCTQLWSMRNLCRTQQRNMRKSRPSDDIEVLENRVFMLIPVTFDAESMLDLNACAKLERFIKHIKEIPAPGSLSSLANWFPSMGKPHKDNDLLWTDFTGAATEDFHPFVRQIASIPKGAIKGQALFAHPLEFAKEDLLSQHKGGKPRQLQIHLGASARKRCGKDAVSIQFLAPRLYGFASGTAILVLEWQYIGNKNGNGGAVFASEVLEGNYAISHPGWPTQKLARSDEDHIGPDDILQIATTLLLPPGFACEIATGRRILYTALRLVPSQAASSKAQLSRLAYRLARRQTSDYQPNPEQFAAGQLSPFANVLHAASIEGGATLVTADDKSPEFLQNIIRNRVRNTYLPLMLVSFHAYFWLVKQTQILPGTSAVENSHNETQQLQSLQERILNFRRVFHFPIASQISQHNEFHGFWQDALKIDRQLESLAELSSAAAAKAQERRVKLLGYLSGGVGGFLLGKELIGAVSEKVTMNTYEWQTLMLFARDNPDNALMAKIQATVQQAETWEWIVIVGAIACGLAGIWVARRFGLRSSP